MFNIKRLRKSSEWPELEISKTHFKVFPERPRLCNGQFNRLIPIGQLHLDVLSDFIGGHLPPRSETVNLERAEVRRPIL